MGRVRFKMGQAYLTGKNGPTLVRGSSLLLQLKRVLKKLASKAATDRKPEA
jgi:hypothetical protein